MSNVSIFEKKWIDLVFEGKNKAYGAYQLRRESPRTTLIAFFVGLLFIGSVSGLGLLLSSFGNHPSFIPPVTSIDTTIVVVKFPDVDKPKKEPVRSNPSSSPIDPTLPQRYVVDRNPDPVDIPTTPTDPSNGTPGDIPGTGPSTVNPAPNGGGSGEGSTVPEGPVMNGLLDVQPEYPGGMKKFYEYVGRNFEKPSIDDVETISVNVSFVIEKDGSMTDIKVLRNPGYGLDKEAVRVLKSLKTKWKPGIKNGQYVRTQYTLPIRIQMN